MATGASPAGGMARASRPRALHAAHACVDALQLRPDVRDVRELRVHREHLCAHLQQQAEQLGRRLVLGRAAVRRARPLELWRHLLI
jgi:hypothetical protein